MTDTPVVCYDRFNPALGKSDFRLSAYYLMADLEDLESVTCTTDCQWVPPTDERLELDDFRMVCYESSPWGHVTQAYVAVDEPSLSALEQFNDGLGDLVGLTDCVWLTPGTVDFSLE